MPVLLPRNLNPFFGSRIRVSPHAIAGLISVRESFLIYLRQQSSICLSFEKLLDSYLSYQAVRVHVFEVDLTDNPAAVTSLRAVIVPQFRVVIGGRERHRHRGTANYEQLDDLFKLF